jgi:glycine betaine/proline transport system ATP-binding protein
MNAVEFRNVDIIFGPQPKRALALLDAGQSREQILASCGHVVGVAGASLSVAPGQICVLMGLSGSGKSTLLRAVNRLNAPARGDVLVRHDGATVNVATCDAGTLRGLRSRGVSMVFQQFALLPWRTVSDNVGIALEMRGMPRRERDKIVAEKLDMVGLTPWARKHAHELSGGMQQRVGLARAFSTDADILLMDEPFSALDPLIRTKLQDELLELQARLKKTILFVSHDLDEAIKLGNHIVIMDGGRIIQAGTVQDIVLRPANAYVSEFVRHMNPLQALRATTFMRPLDRIERNGDALLLAAQEGDISVSLDGRGQPSAASRGGSEAWMAHAATIGDDPAVKPSVVLAGPDLQLQQAVHLRHTHRCPILVVDRDGGVIGSVGEEEILRALVRT